MTNSVTPKGVEQTIYERAAEFIQNGMVVGLGSGRASTKFIELLGEKVAAGLKIRGVPTSQASADLAARLTIPLLTVDEALANGGMIDVTVDGADECDPNLDLIKGYGRALIREKVVAAASRKFVVLFGPGKDVPVLGSKGKLPVEVVPFARALCERKLRELGCDPFVWTKDGKPALTDNGNYILDCVIGPIQDPRSFETAILAIPGVVGTGLFLGMADVVIVGDDNFNKVDERQRRR
jgi:ribose 5-phosphate isomerase A